MTHMMGVVETRYPSTVPLVGPSLQ